MSLCVLEAEISENMKFADFAGGHFGNDVIQIVHPILVMLASIFHGERGPMNKIKQVPYCPWGGGGGGGCTGGLSGPWTIAIELIMTAWLYELNFCKEIK